jgi:hypothetical protein
MPRPRVIADPSRITVTFDKDDYETVRAIAAKQHETNSGVVRRAVRDWLRARNASGAASVKGETPRQTR